MFNTIKRMRFITVSTVALMLLGVLSFQAEATTDPTTTPNAVRTGIGALFSNPSPMAFYQGFDGHLWGTSESGSSWLPVTNLGTPSSTVGIVKTIGTLYAPGGGWEVWIIGTDGNLWACYQSGASYAWTNFGKPSSTDIDGAIGTLYSPGGGWQVWMTGRDGNLWACYQSGASYA